MQADTAQSNDQTLALRAQRGCRDSFDQLARRFQVPLLHFLLARGATQADAEDLLQETFARAFVNLDRYQPKWRFSTWLFTLARRLAINAHRAKRPAPSRETSLAAIAAATPEPSAALAGEENRARLWNRAAETLSEPQFTALWLHYVEGLSTADVARVLGRSRVGVKSLMFHARRKLSVTLAEWSPHTESTDAAQLANA